MVLAFDIGGTKLGTALIDANGAVHAARKTPVDGASLQATVEQVFTEATFVLKEAGVSWNEIPGAGVIVPGIFNHSAGTAWAPNLWGDEDVPLFETLSSRLPIPVRVDTDRVGYVLGEQWLGAAQGLTDIIFVAVGTGIGAGIISSGHLIRGCGNIAGAAGWFALNPSFQEIYRKYGCWESEASGTAVARHAGAPSAEQVVESAHRGEAAALNILDQASHYLAMGIANLISTLNPQMVVLGGGLMQAGDLFLGTIRERVMCWAQPRAASQARIELTQLGEQAGLFGAARLALSDGFI